MVAVAEEHVRRLVRERGPVTFALFTETALYGPAGYYSPGGRTGTRGDYFTAPQAHPAFGALIAVQVQEFWRAVGCPSEFLAVELGAGDGQLAADLTAYAARLDGSFAAALRYAALDRVAHEAGEYPVTLSPANGPSVPHPHPVPEGEGGPASPPPRWGRVRERVTGPLSPSAAGPSVPHPHPLPTGEGDLVSPPPRWGRVRERVKGEPGTGITGCVLSNELLDALPVHRFVVRGGQLRELFVGLDGDRLAMVEGAPSTPLLVERVGAAVRSLPDGFTGEVCLGLGAWAEQVASILDRGFVLTIDYGHERAALYSPERARGTLRTYYKHTLGMDPLAHVGEQDITAHVDFDAVDDAVAVHGFGRAGHTSQREFLMNLGLGDMARRLRSECATQAEADANRAGMLELVKPEGMGGFRVAVHSKGLPKTRITGLHGPKDGATESSQPLPLLVDGDRHIRLGQAAYPHAARHAVPTWDELFSEQ